MTGVWRCPRCSGVRVPVKETGTGRVAVVTTTQRLVCPKDGADLEQMTEPDVELFVDCRSDGHPIESWRGACPCGSMRA